MVELYEAENMLKRAYLNGIAEAIKEKETCATSTKTIYIGRNPMKRKEPKIGRNEKCPCGSGKKYKKCCGGK